VLSGATTILAAVLVLGLPAATLAAGAQVKRPFRIGVLHTAFLPNTPTVEGLRDGLQALGFEEGRDVAFDIRPAKGDVRLAHTTAAALADAGVDLIFVEGEYAARAAKAATQRTPIVFIFVGDPVAAGLVASVPRPEGNLTGVSSLATELTPKRLEIFKSVYPGLRRVWAVCHADDLSSAAASRKAAEAAPLLKLGLLTRAVSTPGELVSHLKALRSGDGLLSPPANTMDIPGLILDLELMARWPAFYYMGFWVEAGGVVSYGSDLKTDAAQAARLVAKILRGLRPQDLPVEGSNKIELSINLKTAKRLGITIPPEISVRADRVIQ
jgi:putative ABC transport system substrate-binding protein